MAIWNLGSLSTFVYNIVEDIPSYISGTTLNELCYQQILFVEQYTGQTIGSTSIAEKFQPALIDLSSSELLKFMEIRGADVSSVSLGDLSISKGQGSSVNSVSERLKASGMDKLKILGKNVTYYKTFG